MSADRSKTKSSTVRPHEAPMLAADVVERRHVRPTADRAYDKFLARGSADGHDVDDWLSSEREFEDEQRSAVGAWFSSDAQQPSQRSAPTI